MPNTPRGGQRKARNHLIRPMVGLKALRLARQLSQQDMADMLDCSKSHYGKFEIGTVAMAYFDAHRLAQWMGVTMESLA